MLNKLASVIRTFVNSITQVFAQFEKQHAFELKNILTCPKTAKHLVNVKVIGKGQDISCLAEEIIADNSFVMGFSQTDVRTIAYLATTDRYEAILREEKIRKSYEIIRSKNLNGKKSVVIRNMLTGDSVLKEIQGLDDNELIENLKSKDAYHLGYLAGQEKTFQEFARLRVLSSKKDENS